MKSDPWKMKRWLNNKGEPNNYVDNKVNIVKSPILSSNPIDQNQVIRHYMPIMQTANRITVPTTPTGPSNPSTSSSSLRSRRTQHTQHTQKTQHTQHTQHTQNTQNTQHTQQTFGNVGRG